MKKKDKDSNKLKKKIKDFVDKNKKILIILVVLIILLIIFFVFKIHDDGTKNRTTVSVGKVISVRNRFAEYDLKVNSIEKEVDVQDAYNEKNSKKFMKINMTIKNVGDNIVDFSGISFNSFNLETISGKIAGSCSMLDKVSYKTDDAIPYMVEAGKTETGFLYCNVSSNTNEEMRLVISTITEIDMDAYKEQGEVNSTESKTFYIKLDN